MIKTAFKFDPNSTTNEGRLRLKDPKIYKRFWRRKDNDDAGIGYVMGEEKESGETSTQAIRFNLNKWDEQLASKWWSKNKSRFHKTWTNKDWSKWKKEKRSNELQITLIKLANYFDQLGFYTIANDIDAIIDYASDKPFDEADHNWEQVLINKDGITKTRRQIRDYYKKNADKIFPYVKDKDVIILIGTATNKNVLKRNVKEGQRIHITKKDGIDDQNSLEYWAARRMIEIHVVLKPKTDVVFVDLDPKTEDMKTKAKQTAKEATKVIKSVFPNAKTEIYSSGKRGYHAMGFLSSPVDTDGARHKLKEALDEYFDGDDDLTTGIAKSHQIRMDTTILHNEGSLRAPYSFTIDGKAKLPLQENDVDDNNDGVPSFMRLKKIDEPNELLKKYKPEDLIIQQKIDGWKTYTKKYNNGIKLYSRRGKDITANLSILAEQLNKQLPNGTAILGEVSVIVNGKQSISQTQTLLGSKPDGQSKINGDIIFYVYDMLEFNNKDITQLSFGQRDKLLRRIIKQTNYIKLLKNYEFNEWQNAVKDALDEGGEGIVIKNKNGIYEKRPSGDTESYGLQWKYKPKGIKSNTEDVILKEYTQGKSKIIFTAYQYKNDELFEVGKISGMDKITEQKLKKQIDDGKDVIIEVSFQERMPSGKYRHMGFVRERSMDKPLSSVRV